MWNSVKGVTPSYEPTLIYDFKSSVQLVTYRFNIVANIVL